MSTAILSTAVEEVQQAVIAERFDSEGIQFRLSSLLRWLFFLTTVLNVKRHVHWCAVINPAGS